MADPSTITNTAGGLTGGGLGSVSGALQGGVTNLVSTGQSYFDRFFPPERRENLKEKLTKFATEKPMFASFILSQVAMSAMPIGLFILMTITVAVFALVAAILVGVVGAVLFIAAAAGFALIILLPTLFITTGAGVFIWLWGVGAYYIVKWFNEKEIPGIHKPLGSAMDNLPSLDGKAVAPPSEDGEKSAPNGHAQKLPPSSRNDSQNRGKSSGVEHHQPVAEARKKADVGGVQQKVDGVTKKVGAGEATKHVDNATGQVTGKLGL